MLERRVGMIVLCFAVLLGVGLVSIAEAAGLNGESVSGGLVTQTFDLQRGWNAIYLEVEPGDDDPSTVFAGRQVDVWAYFSSGSTVEYIDNPAEGLENKPNWYAYYHGTGENFLSTLHSISANRAYLVKVYDGDSLSPLSITGKPVPEEQLWQPGSLNLTGFHLKRGSEPTFATYLAPSSALGGSAYAVYKLRTDGVWESVSGSTAMQAGMSYWVYADGPTNYQGPISIWTGGFGEFNFVASSTEYTLDVYNHGTTASSVTMAVANPAVVLNRIAIDEEQKYPVWAGLAASYSVEASRVTDDNLTVPGHMTFDLGVTETLSDTDSVFEVAGSGMRYLVPVSVKGKPVAGAGLWVGQVIVNGVSRVISGTCSDSVYGSRTTCEASGACSNSQYTTQTDCQAGGASWTPNTWTAPVKPGAEEALELTPAPVNIRLILHKDASGNVRFLKDVSIMWKEGAPGNYVLITRDSRIPYYSGIAVQDGEVVGRRLTSVMFDFSPVSSGSYQTVYHDTAVSCTGALAISGTVVCGLTLDGTHPTNPFRHKYHPDHDGVKSDYYTPEPDEMKTVTRELEFSFTQERMVNVGNPPPGWGTEKLGGTYREYVRGLAKSDPDDSPDDQGMIVVSGKFTLTRISDVDNLNDGEVAQ